MGVETFVSAGTSYKMTVNGRPRRGRKFPVVLFVHSNAGLGAPHGDQIRAFAKALSGLGYLTAVPQYYADDAPHLTDAAPHTQTLTDAISAMLARPEADRDRIGLIGFSLGAATAMTFIASQPRGTVKALGNFFGFLTDTIRNEVSRFPPTIMLHNTNDQIVPVANSRDLDRLIPAAIAHRFVEYDERWQDVNHAFEPGGLADTSSRSEATKWFVKHLPPTGTEP
jgi:dienelactone hydrolase